MVTRVSSAGLFDSAGHLQEEQKARLFDLSRQLATGKKFEKPSDNPLDASAVRRLSTKREDLESRIRAVGLARNLLEAAETSLKEIENLLQRAREIAVRMGSDTFTSADRMLAAAEVNEILEATFRLGNTSSGGRFAFAGADTDAPAFSATRNAEGEITAVAYEGDDVVLEVGGDGGRIPVSIPGSEAFAAVPRALQSTTNHFDGSDATRYADREIAASMIPSSGKMEGAMRVNGKLVRYDLDGDPTTGEGDSLIDLAAKINEAAAGVEAAVEGELTGTTDVADPSDPSDPALAGLTGGTLTIGGVRGSATITIASTDTVADIRDRINVEENRTGVRAEVVDASGNVVDGTPAFNPAAGPFRLRLSGGVEISDDGAGDTNAMRLLGITTTPPAPKGRNLAGTLSAPYRLTLTKTRPGVFEVEDADGSILQDLGVVDGTSPPGNVPPAAVVEEGSVFDALIEMRDELRQGDGGPVRDLVATLDSAIDSVTLHRTTVGSRVASADRAVARLEEEALHLRDLQSRLEEADLTEVIANLRTEQTANEAALRALSGALRLSLLDVLG